MISVGDTVKVIKPTKHHDELVEFIPIGTICRVTEKDNNVICIVPIENWLNDLGFYYMEDEVEKGRLKWIKEE